VTDSRGAGTSRCEAEILKFRGFIIVTPKFRDEMTLEQQQLLPLSYHWHLNLSIISITVYTLDCLPFRAVLRFFTAGSLSAKGA